MNIPSSVSRAASRLALTAGLLAGPGCDVSPSQSCATADNTAPFHQVVDNIHSKAEQAIHSMRTLLETQAAHPVETPVTFSWGTHYPALPVVQMGDSFVECHTDKSNATVCGIGILEEDPHTPNNYNAVGYTEININPSGVRIYPANNVNATTLEQADLDKCEAFDGNDWGVVCSGERRNCTDTIADISKQTYSVYSAFLQKIEKQP